MITISVLEQTIKGLLPPDFSDQGLYPVKRGVATSRLVNVLDRYGVEHDGGHHS